MTTPRDEPVGSVGDGRTPASGPDERPDDALAAALAALPPKQREAVVLVMVEGFGYKEAAEILGIPQGTLTSRLGRGREALLRELGEAA